MGSSPRTKAEYRTKIAELQGDLARARVAAKEYKTLSWKNEVARLQSEIARLRAEMANAPK